MITPTEFKSFRDYDQEQAIENHIDNALRNASGRPYVTIQILGWRADAILKVLAKYRAAGWITDVVGDWRDGDFISMVAP